MDDKFEKKLKDFLPYIIIIGVVYLFLPSILVFTKSEGVLNQIVYIGVFPLTALLCSLHYGYKKENDLLLSFVAPVIYIPSMLLYGNLRDSVLNTVIFLVSYFICGYIGLTLGDMIKSSKEKQNGNASERKAVATVVNTDNAYEEEDELCFDNIELPQQYDEEVESVQYQEDEPIFEPADSYTEDDIDAILAEIHSRND